MNTEKKYGGVVIPAVTPLTPDYKLDRGAVKRIFDNFRKHGVHPFILGTTGEAASLSSSLKKEFLELAGKLKEGNDVLYAGISSNVLEESVALAKHSFDNGADVVVTTLPSYYALTEWAMLRYFEQLAEAVAGPLMIYNIPATTHMSIPLSVIDQLSRHHNLVGVKDSERNESRLRESLQLWSHRKDFSHFLGWAAKSADAILEGGDGLVPSTGNFHPGLYSELYKAAKEGDKEKARRLQSLSDSLGNLYQQGRTLGESLWALKLVMGELGLCQPNVAPPIYPQTGEEAGKLKTALEEIIKSEQINF